MKTAALPQTSFTASHNPLRHCCLITDGNTHRSDLCRNTIGFTHPDLISEAMLPEIRTVAMMIAAMRHDFTQRSPETFTEEADWFAARIIVLRARAFHLDVRLNDMLQIANQRAQAFAAEHHLPFQAAQIRASLHHKRPANMLLMECDLATEIQENVFSNTQNVRQEIRLHA
ncbi:hypothetical protein MIS45_06445 [Wielerella bovis]|uniref:hypothetical protein n=1 Tax=Wielerella bovis TaxID=2917790 RepID=UPI002018BF0E|nr:hypothetical protein [Wielerella bovis]ULJ68449.1 hypothetical protein MIS45_06445 [Wielerella bovis]